MTKLPACRWKCYQEFRMSADMQNYWFNERHCNVGIVFTEASGRLTSIDFDEPGSYDRWAEQQPALARSLPTVQTRRGHHVYFHTNHGTVREIRKQIGKPNGVGAIATGVGEYRTGRCYSAAPASVHPTGFKYHWAVDLPPVGSPFPLIDPREVGLLDVDDIIRRQSNVSKRLTKCSPHNPGGYSHSGGLRARGGIATAGSDGLATGVLGEHFDAIEATLPIGPGQRRSQLFLLARVLRGRRAVSDVNQLLPLVKAWHRAALPVIRTKDFDASWSDFRSAWDDVTHPIVGFTLSDALAAATLKPLPAIAKQFQSSSLQVLVSLCKEMQSRSEWDFFISTRTVARLLSVSQRSAVKYLNRLTAAKVLEITQEHPRKSRKATQYRYIGD